MKKLLLVLCLLFPIAAHATIIPITGTITGPDGTPLTGSVVFTLSYGAARDFTNNNMVVARTATFPVIQGQIRGNARIVPNDDLQPGNTYYTVDYYDSYSAQIAENFFYISGTSFDLGTAIPTTVTTNNLSFATLGNYWTRAVDPQGNGRVDLYPQTVTDRVLVGLTSSDDLDQNDIITSGCLASASGALNAFIGTLCFANNALQLTAGTTGTQGSIRPLTFHIQQLLGSVDKEALMLRPDSASYGPWLQLTDSDAGLDVPAAGQVGLRNHAGVFELSNGGAAWTPVASGGASPWTRAAPFIYPTASTDKTVLGATSSDAAGTSFLIAINPGYLGVVSAQTDGASLTVSIQAGVRTTISSSHTGAGTNLPFDILTAGTTRMRFQTGGNIDIGATVDTGFKVDLTGTFHAKAAVAEAVRIESTSGTIQQSWYNSGTLFGLIAANTNEFDFCSKTGPCNGGIGLLGAGTGVSMFGSSAGSPGTPGAGVYVWYVDSSDGNKLKVVGSSGTVTTIANP